MMVNAHCPGYLEDARCCPSVSLVLDATLMGEAVTGVATHVISLTTPTHFSVGGRVGHLRGAIIASTRHRRETKKSISEIHNPPLFTSTTIVEYSTYDIAEYSTPSNLDILYSKTLCTTTISDSSFVTTHQPFPKLTIKVATKHGLFNQKAWTPGDGG